MSQSETFPALPQGLKRFGVEQLLMEIGTEIGLRAHTLMALLHMMKHTRPDDWTRSDREPVYFAPQDVTAAELGKTPRALRTIERQLERLGFVERRVKANGHRSSYAGCGIVFSRLVARLPDLLELAERLREDQRRRKELRYRRSSFLRIVKSAIREAGPTPPPIIEAASAAIAAWPTTEALHQLDLAALADHVEAAKGLCEHLGDYGRDNHDSSGSPEENDRLHIQENNRKTSSVTCNPAPNGVDQSEEDKRATEGASRKHQFLSRLDPERLCALASDELRTLIRRSQGGAPIPSEVHLIDGVTKCLPIIGINWNAWEQAVARMGLPTATLAVLILDANRDHPTTPVRNPGGALRAMTQRHEAGSLNLVGSLIGLDRRRGYGGSPKEASRMGG